MQARRGPEYTEQISKTLRLGRNGNTEGLEMIRTIRAYNPKTRIIVLTAYGLTEASGFGTMCRADDDAVTVATTSGRPIASSSR